MRRFYRVQEVGSSLRYHKGYLLCMPSIEDVKVVVREWYGEDCDLYKVTGDIVSKHEEDWDGKKLTSYLVSPREVELIGKLSWKEV